MLRFVALALSVAATQAGNIASYAPPTNVVEHAEIDLDQEEIETELKKKTDAGYAAAKTIYDDGKYSTKSSGMRPISGFSKDLSGEPLFDEFKAYYGDDKFSDIWVTGALTKTKADFTSNGDADFATVNDDATREQAVKKGTVFLSIWPYAVHELESALKNCGVDETKSLHYLDEGVAFYTGSLVGADATGDTKGKLMWGLAESRCTDFKTCGTAGSYSTTGLAESNKLVFEYFEELKAAIKAETCDAIRPLITKVTNIGFIPIIQGTLKYAFEVGPDGSKIGDTKYQAEAATFAAAVLPRVATCSATDAATIYANTKIGAASCDFAAVKTALENNYACMGVTSTQIGGFMKDGVYKKGFSAGSSGLGTGPLIGIIAGAVVGVVIVAFAVMKLKGGKGKGAPESGETSSV